MRKQILYLLIFLGLYIADICFIRVNYPTLLPFARPTAAAASAHKGAKAAQRLSMARIITPPPITGPGAQAAPKTQQEAAQEEEPQQSPPLPVILYDETPTQAKQSPAQLPTAEPAQSPSHPPTPQEATPPAA